MPRARACAVVATGVLLFGSLTGCRSAAVESTPARSSTSAAVEKPPPPVVAPPPSDVRSADVDEKLEDALIREIERRRGATPGGLPHRPIEVAPDGTVLVDIRAKVGPGLLERIRMLGGTVVSSVPNSDAVEARVPIDGLRQLAAEPDVRSIRRALGFMTNSVVDAPAPPR